MKKGLPEPVRKPATRGRILPSGSYYVHVMSRVVNRDYILGPEEKVQLRKLMRMQAEFSGLTIVTYAIMDNHFHILLQVPDAEDLDDAEIIRRIDAAGGEGASIRYGQMMERFAKRGQRTAAAEYRQKTLDRMYDLSAYMQQLKRLFTRWYNRRKGRKGTLWEERYKSVVVQGTGHPLLTMAAYIDLNPVRAGLVKDPKDYAWSGYGEAVAGSKLAREGLTIIAERLGRSTAWRMVHRTYRKLIYGAGEQGPKANQRAGFTREQVKEVWDADGELSLQELLHCRVRYFTDAVVIGSRAYVDEVFGHRRNYFSERREGGARKLRNRALDGLYSLRDLRVDLVD